MKKFLTRSKENCYVSDQEREEAAQIIVEVLLKQNVPLKDIKHLSGKSTSEIQKIAKSLKAEVNAKNEQLKSHE